MAYTTPQTPLSPTQTPPHDPAQPRWDRERDGPFGGTWEGANTLDARDHLTLQAVLLMLNEMGLYHAPPPAAAAAVAAASSTAPAAGVRKRKRAASLLGGGSDGEDDGDEPGPSGLLRFWIIEHGAPHFYLQVLAHFSVDVRNNLARTLEMFALDPLRIDPVYVESGYDRECGAWGLGLRLQMHASPQPLQPQPHRIHNVVTLSTWLHRPVPPEGLQVRQTRDGTVYSNTASPRSKARKTGAAGSPRRGSAVNTSSSSNSFLSKVTGSAMSLFQ